MFNKKCDDKIRELQDNIGKLLVEIAKDYPEIKNVSLNLDYDILVPGYNSFSIDLNYDNFTHSIGEEVNFPIFYDVDEPDRAKEWEW